jgi:hypothetical protein
MMTLSFLSGLPSMTRQNAVSSEEGLESDADDMLVELMMLLPVMLLLEWLIVAFCCWLQ